MNSEYQHLTVGDIVQVNGRWMKYLGSGLYEPLKPETLEKRFDPAECGPLVTNGHG